MTKSLNLLIVEDSEDDAILISRQITAEGYDLTWDRVCTREAMVNALDLQDWDIIIADHAMPSFSATAALDLVNRKGLEIPFIIVSGAIGEKAAVAALKAGAHDYVMKDNLVRLVPALERGLADVEIRKEHRKTTRSLRESEEKFRLLSEQRLMALFILQEEQLVDVNQAMADLLGYSMEEMLNWKERAYHRIIRPEDQSFVLDQALMKEDWKKETVVNYQWRAVTRTGETKWVESYSKPMLFNNRPAVLITMVDVTGQIKTEEALAAKIEQLDEFNRLVISRELVIIELKEEVNQLLKKRGIEKKYTNII
jgi:two-component system cell cycle sensor histidine kinase/response regulator CckA